MKLFKKRESGQALIMALILLALGSLLVLPLLRQSFTNLGYHQSIECQTLNSYSADAGIVYATAKIYMNPGTYLETPLDVSFELNGRTVNVTADYQGGGLFSVNSTASGGGCGRTKIVSYINISVGAFAYAVAGKNSISISNSAIDSSPDPGEAHIYSNGDISITGFLVNGDAFAVGEITKGKEYIAGEIEEGADALQFPSVYDQLYKNIAQEGGNWTGDLVYDAGIYNVGPLYITGNLELKPGANVTLDGPLYVVGDIKVNSGLFYGREHILSEGRIDITSGAYESENIPVITSLTSDIDLVGPVVSAVLYAPEGQVRAQNLQLFGAIGGVDCIVSHAIIVYSQSLHGRQDLPGSELFPLTYGYE